MEVLCPYRNVPANPEPRTQTNPAMNLKIECPCGQKIAFEVEPENGAMPCELPCPSSATSAKATE